MLAGDRSETELSSVNMTKAISSEYQELAKETRDWIRFASDSLKEIETCFNETKTALV